MSRKGRLKMSRRAQSTMEYFTVFSIIVLALVAMQVYLKRGMQGRLRGYAEQLTQGSAYSPGATNSLGTITRDEEEQTNSYTQNNNGNKLSITESSTQINQITDRIETTLSFADEPRRW